MPRIADTPQPSDDLDNLVWRRAVSDGHLHRLPIDCPHWPPLESCAECCPHPDDPPTRIDLMSPDDELDDDWSSALALFCALIGFLIMVGSLYATVYGLIAINGG